MMLAEFYRARAGSGFGAYMTLQRALLARWVARGGSEAAWCVRLAPRFRERYGALLGDGGDGDRHPMPDMTA